MRARNNLASALSDDEPARATRMFLEGMELAREIGDRRFYFWLAGTAAPGLMLEGRDWDRHAALLSEALETATIRYDRVRLRILLGLLEMPRGERLEELVADLTEIVGDSTEPDLLLALYMGKGEVSLLSGDPDTAWAFAMKAVDLKLQNPDVPLLLAARAAIWSRDLDRARAVARLIAGLPGTGALTQLIGVHNAAAIAALEGRTDEAVAGFREVDARVKQLEQYFQAAMYAVDAAVLLPTDPQVRALVEDARPLLVRLRAKPYLDRLDQALAGVPVSAIAAASPAGRATDAAEAADAGARTGS
jgi:hypothetical protein